MNFAARRCSIARTAIVLLALPLFANAQSPATSDWGYYGGDIYGQRYSKHSEITPENVADLEVAWEYRSGELGKGLRAAAKMTFEATPILAFGRLYFSTATDIVIALDPTSGRELWRFDPQIKRDAWYAEVTSRGVSAWVDRNAARESACQRRIFIATLDARLLALDAETGKPCMDFADHGVRRLDAGIRIRDASDYLVTSPPAVIDNLVVVGSAIGDNRAAFSERGVIRAFDAVSGELRWSFDPLPDNPEHAAAAEWDMEQALRTGGGNAWGVMTVDPVRKTVFVPTGAPSPDFFGGERKGSNRFANSLLALDGATGKLRWHRQLVHHDLWDFDLAAQPTLADLDRARSSVPTVIQATKQGLIFVFDRDSGEPVFNVAERAVPQSTVAGESSWPTQPFPATPALVSPRPVRPEDAWGLTFYDRGRCRKRIEALRNDGIFTPPDTRGTLLRPSYVGGVNWGGVAFDVGRQRLVTAVNHMPMVVTLIPPEEVEQQRRSGDYPHAEFALQLGTRWAMRREPLLSPFGLPCTAPPWGTLAAIDMLENRVLWEVPLGSTEDVAPPFLPVREFGLPHMGGPVVTASGLIFIAAAMDGYIRAFHSETGKVLWKHKLPAGGQATPMIYRAGRQQREYVVIAAGGHGGLGTRRGDYVIAFALPAAPGKSPP
ncbi:MAG: pyrroloquinoline quinone-dependent dehydrogenase [Steroidobacteraceae bacterium]